VTKKLVAIGLAVVAIVVGGVLISQQPATRPDWARCTPNAPLACSTVEGVALGGFVQSWDPVTGRDAPRASGVAPCTEPCGPLAVARAELDLLEPGHPVVASIGQFSPDWFVFCGGTICKSSGYLGVFVFTFTDANMRPIVVGCGPIWMTCHASDGYGRSH
jgi:hypothetical protein